MLETAERLTDRGDASRPLQQFLLLVGGLRALAGGEHEPALVLDAYLLRSLPSPAGRRASTTARAAARRARTAPFSVAAGGARLRRLPAARLGGARAARRSSCWPRCSPATGRSPTPATHRHRREGSGLVAAYLQWHLERGLRSLRLVERA